MAAIPWFLFVGAWLMHSQKRNDRLFAACLVGSKVEAGNARLVASQRGNWGLPFRLLVETCQSKL